MLAVPPAELGGLPPGTSVPGLERFSKRKRQHRPIAQALMASPEFESYARAISNCANTLELALGLPEGGEPTLQLTDCLPCNRRLCPFCEWRRSRVWRGRLLAGLEPYFAARPTDSAVFLTLTQKNVPLGELATTLQAMHRSWDRLRKWRSFPSDFWLRRTEITIGRAAFSDDLPRQRRPQNAPAPGEILHAEPSQKIPHFRPTMEEGMQTWCHPHIHVLLLVPASYWSHGYLKQGEWARQWQMASRLDYTPVVDVRRARAKNQPGQALADAKDAAIEAAKYTVKASDLIGLGEQLPEFAHQIRSHRLVSMSAGLRKFVPDHDPSASEMADERDHSKPALCPTISCVAQWCGERSEYHLTPR